MNRSMQQELTGKMKSCILRGNKDAWMRLFLITDDVAYQSMSKWFDDYFVFHKVKNCDINLDGFNDSLDRDEFRCLIRAGYQEHDDFTDCFLVKTVPDKENGELRIVSMEQVYSSGHQTHCNWHSNLKEETQWWKSSLLEKELYRNVPLPSNLAARAVTRNIRFREAHIQLECASLLACMMSRVIPYLCRQLNLPHENSEEKIRTLYGVVRDKFSLQIIRPDRNNTWASKFLAPWYGIEEVLAGHEGHQKIAVSCNVFMTALYSLLRWNGLHASQLVQFRIMNQDYLLIQDDEEQFYLISHDKFTVCNKKTIYPSGKIDRVFGAEWFIDFKNNLAVATPELIQTVQRIAKQTFLPIYSPSGKVMQTQLINLDSALNKFRQSVFRACRWDNSGICLWAKYAHQTLFVPHPETYVYWSVQSNWDHAGFQHEQGIFEFLHQMKRTSIFPEDDRVMTADQCIRHQTGGEKDLAVFLYAALKKFLQAQGCVIFTKRYAYCVYYSPAMKRWVIYNVSLLKAETSIDGEVLLAFNDTNSYYPLIDKGHTNRAWFYDMIGKLSI